MAVRSAVRSADSMAPNSVPQTAEQKVVNLVQRRALRTDLTLVVKMEGCSGRPTGQLMALNSARLLAHHLEKKWEQMTAYCLDWRLVAQTVSWKARCLAQNLGATMVHQLVGLSEHH